MSKRKYHGGKSQGEQQRKGHTLFVPQVGVIELALSRTSTTPFCAYYGPQGQTCSATTDLQLVGTLPGVPVYHYLACPLHYEAVSQMLRNFLASLEDHARRTDH